MSPDREPGDRAFWDTSGSESPTEPPAEPKDEPAAFPAPKLPQRRERAQEAIVGWARAVAMGVRDTAHDVLDEGRSGARAKRSQMWDRFDRKTKGRRTRE